jgi:hypothetical protein
MSYGRKELLREEGTSRKTSALKMQDAVVEGE